MGIVCYTATKGISTSLRKLSATAQGIKIQDLNVKQEQNTKEIILEVKEQIQNQTATLTNEIAQVKQEIVGLRVRVEKLEDYNTLERGVRNNYFKWKSDNHEMETFLLSLKKTISISVSTAQLVLKKVDKIKLWLFFLVFKKASNESQQTKNFHPGIELKASGSHSNRNYKVVTVGNLADNPLRRRYPSFE